MLRKAQVEFVVLIVLVAAVVSIVAFSYYYLSSSHVSVPADIAQKQNLVKLSMENLIDDAGETILGYIETYGGYPFGEYMFSDFNIDDDSGFVYFQGRPVPLWQACNEKIYPTKSEIMEYFKTGVENYIKEHVNEVLDAFSEDYQIYYNSENVIVENAFLRNDRISVSFRMPISIRNYSISGSFSSDIPTRLDRIYDFASDLSSYQAEKRIFELFTINALSFSSDLPTSGFLFNCGDFILKTPDEVSEGLNDIVRHVLSNLFLWNIIKPSGDIPKYKIIDLYGKKYDDLDIDFRLSDNFELQSFSPILITNTNPVIKSPIPLATSWGICMVAYSQTYRLEYPIVIRVYDDLTQRTFNFANYVFVDSEKINEDSKQEIMVPGECSFSSFPEITACENLQCSAKIEVKDDLGNILSGASVIYNNCYLGSTDENGIIEGSIKCEDGNLTISYSSDYEVFNEEIRFSDVDGTYILRGIPEIEFTFESVSDPFKGGDCSTSSVDHEIITLNIKHLDTGKEYTLMNLDKEKTEQCIELNDAACERCQNQEIDCDKCLEITESCKWIVSPTLKMKLPYGKYEADLMIFNMYAQENYEAKGDCDSVFGIPIMIPNDDETFTFSISPTKKSLTIHVPETDKVYLDVADMCEEWEDFCGAFGCQNERGEEVARALALNAAMNRLLKFKEIPSCIGQFESSFKYIRSHFWYNILGQCTNGCIVESGSVSCRPISLAITDCGDGIDNDEDGNIDYPEDDGCDSLVDLTETHTTVCNDGLDNDCDGLIDYCTCLEWESGSNAGEEYRECKQWGPEGCDPDCAGPYGMFEEPFEDLLV